MRSPNHSCWHPAVIWSDKPPGIAFLTTRFFAVYPPDRSRPGYLLGIAIAAEAARGGVLALPERRALRSLEAALSGHGVALRQAPRARLRRLERRLRGAGRRAAARARRARPRRAAGRAGPAGVMKGVGGGEGNNDAGGHAGHAGDAVRSPGGGAVAAVVRQALLRLVGNYGGACVRIMEHPT